MEAEQIHCSLFLFLLNSWFAYIGVGSAIIKCVLLEGEGVHCSLFLSLLNSCMFILVYWILQSEIEGVSGDDTAMSPGPQSHQQQTSIQQQQQAVAGAVGSMATSGPGQAEAPAVPADQSKSSVFTGALASPIRWDLPALSTTLAGYGLPNHGGHLGKRTGMGLEQHAELAWEDEQTVAPYHDASSTAGFAFHQTQHQHQQGRDGQSFGENDASMDMHGGEVGDGYFH